MNAAVIIIIVYIPVGVWGDIGDGVWAIESEGLLSIHKVNNLILQIRSSMCTIPSEIWIWPTFPLEKHLSINMR